MTWLIIGVALVGVTCTGAIIYALKEIKEREKSSDRDFLLAAEGKISQMTDDDGLWRLKTIAEHRVYQLQQERARASQPREAGTGTVPI